MENEARLLLQSSDNPQEGLVLINAKYENNPDWWSAEKAVQPNGAEL